MSSENRTLKYHFFSYLIGILWALLLFDGSIWMMQLLIFHGHEFSVHTPLIILVSAILIYYTISQKININNIFIFWSLFLLLCIISALLSPLSAEGETIKQQILLSAVPLLYYSLIPLLAGSKVRISQYFILALICIYGAIAIFTGINQWVSGYSELTQDYMHIMGVTNYNFFGTKRPISIFAQMDGYGFFLAFLSGIVLSFAMAKKNSLVKFTLVIVVMFLIWLEYTSMTRATYLLFALVVWFAVSFRMNRGFLLLYPLSSLFIGACIYSLAPLAHQTLDSIIGKVASDASMTIRYHEASIYLHIFLDNYYYLFFGPGSNATKLINHHVFIDNTYITILMQSGILGLCAYIIAFSYLWLHLYHKAKSDPTPLRISIAAVFGAWPCIGFFAVDKYYLLVAAIGLVLRPQKSCNHTVMRPINESHD